MGEKVVVIGGGGHGRVVMDIIRCRGDHVCGVLDDGRPTGTEIDGAVVLGPISAYTHYIDHCFVIAIGNNEIRRQIACTLPVRWYTGVHPSAVIAGSAEIGEGTVVMANAVVNPGAVIGKHCILNTGGIVEHDNYIEDYVHLSPGSTLGGTVRIGMGTHVGIGAVIKNNVSVCEKCTIGAGAVVVKDIGESGVYVGVPVHKQ